MPGLRCSGPGRANAGLSCSATDALLQVFRITRPMYRYFRGSAVDPAKIVSRQLDRPRADVLFEPMQLGRAGNRHDPRLLGEQPRERDLRGCCPLLGRNPVEQIDHSVICFAILRGEAWDNVAEIAAVESGLLV